MRKSAKSQAKPSTDTFYIGTETLASQFARDLQEAIQSKVVNRVLRTRFMRPRSFIITPSSAVKDKLEQLTAFKAAGLSCPRFCTSRLTWPHDVKTLFARTVLRGTQGEGIIEFNPEDQEWPRAPLYVEYIPKSKEFRFHVLGDKVIDVQEKRKKREFDADARNPRIRNVDNGYVFCRGDLHYDDTASTLAVQAVASLDYSYGAVDIIYSKQRNQYFVLEVNSKPGIEGSTPEYYANAIIDQFSLTRI